MSKKSYQFFCLLTLLFVFEISSVYAVSDSIYFSKDGKHVLQTSRENTHLNGCKCNYWLLFQVGNSESEYYVTFLNDSVYLLYYDGNQSNPPYFKVNQCKTNAKIYEIYSLNDFKNRYQLAIPSKTTTDSVSFNLDTIRTRHVHYFGNDSTIYYDIHVAAYLNNEKIVDEFVSINIPGIDYNYKVYYSQTENYYFVTGGFSFGERTDDGISESVSLSFKEINRIGKIGNSDK